MEQYGGAIEQVTITATAAGTTTLVNTSHQIQVFTGSTTQTVKLPVATTYTKPAPKFEIYNRSTGAVAVQFQDGSSLQSIPASASLIVKLVDNTTANGVWVTLSNSSVPSVSPPTVQKFLSGSGTYTAPVSPAPLYLKIKMVGGGGGGGGVDGIGVGGTGSTGGNTTFGSSFLVANGGVGGGFGTNGGAGGTASIAGGALGIALSGGQGGGSEGDDSSPRNYSGGSGGTNPLGGSGSGGFVDNGQAASANTGAGGGGGGSQFTTSHGISAAGGGASGYVEAIVNSPSATYAYSVGIAGAGYAGSTFVGGAGGSGLILIEEHYQ